MQKLDDTSLHSDIRVCTFLYKKVCMSEQSVLEHHATYLDPLISHTDNGNREVLAALWRVRRNLDALDVDDVGVTACKSLSV